MKRSGFRRSEKATSPIQRRPMENIADPEQRAAALDASARRSLRRIGRLKSAAADAEGSTTPWEAEFLDDVEGRIEKFGRAFADPDKGNLALATSIKQARKIRQIERSVKRRAERA